MLRKVMCMLILLSMTLALAACGNNPASAEQEPKIRDVVAEQTAKEQAELDAQQEQSRKESEEEANTEEETLEETPVEQETTTSFDWVEYTYDTKDSDGYTFRITIKLSPWILYSETDSLNAAWSVVGNNHSLPTFDSWGFEKHGNECYKPYTTGDYIWDSCNWLHAMNDMYYCVGSVSIENTTEGWDITDDSPRTAVATMILKPYETNATSITQVFYSNSTDMRYNGIYIKANMTSNSWGPVPFVFMTPENFSPNTPNGEYLDQLKTEYFGPDNDPIYVGIIGKNGEHYS